jgi:hypothetical protein
LGDSEGQTGPAALRGLLTESGKGSADLRCAALLALGKRCRARATKDFGEALSSAPLVRDYALACLAAWGHDGYWEPVTRLLAQWLRKPRPSEPSLFIGMVTYLSRIAADDSRRSRLVELIQAHAQDLPAEDSAWLERHWSAPHDLSSHTPHVEAMQGEWLAQHLFQALDDEEA